ncbi:MAG: SCP2 sterol-binding domain-containing protein [Deltaproteobacteria bacterium]|nr:SCP2 sterol-binding domain-containing protein [Deltaproteobacteria bacterium]
MPQFIASPDLPEDGFGSMLLDMIRQNLEEKPEKKKAFSKLKARVAIVARDSDVSVTLVFMLGTLTVLPGVDAPDITISADSAEILGLSSVPLRLGLPDPLSPEGRDMLKGLSRGRLKIRGMLTHPLALIRLTEVMSVA